MSHTFFFREWTWIAKGRYFDGEGRVIHAQGETKITHGRDKWLNEGISRLSGDNAVELRNAYEITPFAQGRDSTEWRSASSALGPIYGRLMIVDDSIFSMFRSEDGLYSGSEFLLMMDEHTYKARGVLFKGDEKISSWSVELKKKG